MVTKGYPCEMFSTSSAVITPTVKRHINRYKRVQVFYIYLHLKNHIVNEMLQKAILQNLFAPVTIYGFKQIVMSYDIRTASNNSHYNWILKKNNTC